MSTDTPSAWAMRASCALCEDRAISNHDTYGEDTAMVDIARELDAAREEGRRAGLEEAPVLTLRQRTPEEAKAYRDGARMAINLVLGRLPGVIRHPADEAVPTADVRAAAAYAHGIIQTVEDVANYPKVPHG